MSQKQIQTQGQELSQKQKVELRQLFLTQLVEAGNLEMPEVVAKAMDENPALEIEQEETLPSEETYTPEEDGEESEYDHSQGEEDDYSDNSDNWETDVHERLENDPNPVIYERQIAAQPSFRENLLLQLRDMPITDQERDLAIFLIGSIADDGYLQCFSEQQSRDKDKESAEYMRFCMEMLAHYWLVQDNPEVSVEEFERVLTQVVQQLEPPGIGARNLHECLTLQVKAYLKQHDDEVARWTLLILQNHFRDFSRKRYDRICRQLSIPSDRMKDIVDFVHTLEPHPGGGGEEVVYINPDFEVSIERGEPRLSLTHEYHPRLRVNREYQEQLSRAMAKKRQENARFFREYIEKAQLFIDVLSERDRTLYLIMNEIVSKQKEFFLTGDFKKLKPMVLRDIAQKVGYGVSTVSRATSRRYVQTPFGTFSLKSLFSEAANEEDGVSANAIRDGLKELVEKEDKRKPYTDERLAELLKQRGYNISRRTVAKYRQQLGISATSVRKTE